jgi:hypothetical protein
MLLKVYAEIEAKSFEFSLNVRSRKKVFYSFFDYYDYLVDMGDKSIETEFILDDTNVSRDIVEGEFRRHLDEYMIMIN